MGLNELLEQKALKEAQIKAQKANLGIKGQHII